MPTAHPAPKVVVSYGMGVDSTAILLRWFQEPETQPCADDDILIVTAMTGNEWYQTRSQVETHMLDIIRAKGWRFAQIARRGNSSAHGYVVLSDTNDPDRLYVEGDFSLADEMLAAGTVPQVGGTRKCSIKAKGEPLDAFIWDQVGEAPFVHVMGFESNEQSRAVRDSKDGRKGLEKAGRDPEQRTPSYPLIEWGWDRQACLDYIAKHLGVNWEKSACVFCPFALSNKANRAETLKRFAASPQESLLALRMEHTSVALNPEQTLMVGGLENVIDQTSWDAFSAWLRGTEHAVYEVRRINRPKADDPTQIGTKPRSVKVVATGPREQMLWELDKVSRQHRHQIEVDGRDGLINRVWIERRAGVNTADHLFVVAPAGVTEKQLKNFETWWDARVA